MFTEHVPAADAVEGGEDTVTLRISFLAEVELYGGRWEVQ